MVSIRLLPIAAQAIGWQWVLSVPRAGPFLGALALARIAAKDVGLAASSPTE
jgi:hypothetical protein